LKPSNHTFNFISFIYFKLQNLFTFQQSHKASKVFGILKKKVVCKVCHIKCDVMGFDPKAIAIFPNLKYGSFSTMKIRKNTFLFLSPRCIP
jgi:hypothetical protein